MVDAGGGNRILTQLKSRDMTEGYEAYLLTHKHIDHLLEWSG